MYKFILYLSILMYKHISGKGLSPYIFLANSKVTFWFCNISSTFKFNVASMKLAQDWLLL